MGRGLFAVRLGLHPPSVPSLVTFLFLMCKVMLSFEYAAALQQHRRWNLNMHQKQPWARATTAAAASLCFMLQQLWYVMYVRPMTNRKAPASLCKQQELCACRKLLARALSGCKRMLDTNTFPSECYIPLWFQAYLQPNLACELVQWLQSHQNTFHFAARRSASWLITDPAQVYTITMH